MFDTIMTDVGLEEEATSLEDSSTRVLRKCGFCEKETSVYQQTNPLLDRLSGPQNFHCGFCLRHDLNTKKNKNVLITSFRGIIGYLYYACYRVPYQPKLYLRELQDLIESHKKVGLLNPVFSYDEDSFHWFIDFNKVASDHRKKIELQEVQNTISEIITAFNLFEYIELVNLHVLVKKYHDAIKTFYETRKRPEDWKVLTPTLKGTNALSYVKVSNANNNHTTRRVPIEETRDFTPDKIEASPMR